MPLGGDLVLQQCGMLNLKLSLTNDTIHLLFPSFQTSQSVDPAGFASQSSHARARIPVSHPTGGRLGTAGVPGQEQSHRPPSVREYHLPPSIPFSVQYWLVTFDLQVGYLATKKPRTVSIVQCFRMFFADEALRRYNWNGLDSPRYPKRPMKNYDIFTSCMLGMVCCSTRITT